MFRHDVIRSQQTFVAAFLQGTRCQDGGARRSQKTTIGLGDVVFSAKASTEPFEPWSHAP